MLCDLFRAEEKMKTAEQELYFADLTGWIQMNLTVSFFISGHLRETKQIMTPCSVGRSSQSSWVLGHPMLSRNHYVLFDQDEKLYLRDEGSLNGTRFKGVPVKEPVRLQFGDEFTVGDNLIFRVSAPTEKKHHTDTLDSAEQTTDVHHVKGAFASQQSTLLTKE